MFPSEQLLLSQKQNVGELASLQMFSQVYSKSLSLKLVGLICQLKTYTSLHIDSLHRTFRKSFFLLNLGLCNRWLFTQVLVLSGTHFYPEGMCTEGKGLRLTHQIIHPHPPCLWLYLLYERWMSYQVDKSGYAKKSKMARLVEGNSSI